MSKHTQEPWEVVRVHGVTIGCGNTLNGAHRMIANVVTCTEETVAQNDANFSRIVACVNGCEGIEPSAVPELLAACEALVTYDKNGRFGVPSFSEAIWRARDAIAKAKGGAQ